MKPKNKKQFNWSYIRFYLMWLITTLLVLVPMVVLFSNLIKCDECKRIEKNKEVGDVKNVNYEELVKGLDSLNTIVKFIDVNKDSRELKRNLDILDEYRDDFIIQDNKEISETLRSLAGEIYGLTFSYIDLMEQKEKSRENLLKLKDEKISDLDNQITVLRSQLNSIINRK